MVAVTIVTATTAETPITMLAMVSRVRPGRCWIDRVPVPKRLDPSLPGGWAYEPITVGVIEAWIAPLREQFAMGAALPDEERAVG